ncbi:hypothetical protein ACWIGM_09185 [Bosea sp. NPDC055332]
MRENLVSACWVLVLALCIAGIFLGVAPYPANPAGIAALKEASSHAD